MNRWLSFTFSPWIPASVLWFIVLVHSQLTFESGDALFFYLLLAEIALFVVMLLLIAFRAVIKSKRDRFNSNVILSIDFLALYIVLSVLFFLNANSLMGGTKSALVSLLFFALSLAVLYRCLPTPFQVVSALLSPVLRFLLEMIFGANAAIARPDVLAEKGNVEAVKSFLTDQIEGVYCGQIRHKKTLEPLYISTEDRGVVIGPPGTGKTAFMVTQLLDLAERKGSFVCLDIKPELHTIMREKLEAQGYRVLVFNPTNPVDKYNFLDDLQGPTAVGELAYSLVPSADGDNRAFDEGARDLLDGIISYLRYEKKAVSLPALQQFLSGFSSEKGLIQTLSQCDDPDVKDTAFAIARSAKNARFMGSVFATLRSNLRFLRYEDIRTSIGESDFSLALFKEAQPVALFLQFEERHQETTQLLLSAMIAHLFNYFIEDAEREPVLLMLDEIGNVPRIPGLVAKLNTIRSRKLPTWMYWQGIQQMQKYGKQANEGPNSIMAACDFHMAFRLNDNDSARWFSERIGTVDRQVITSTAGGEHHSTSHQVKEEQILKVADLQALPFGESVAIYRGKVWRNYATPYFERWPEMAR